MNLVNELVKVLRVFGVEFIIEDKRILIYFFNFKGVMLFVSEFCIKDCFWILGSFDV